MEPTHLKLEKVAPFWLQKHPETLSRFDLKIWGDQPGNLCQDAACAHAGPGKVVVEFFFGRFQVGVSKNRGAPKWMVYNENPIKMDDLGVPLFSETSRWMLNMWPVGFGFSDLVLDFRLIRNFLSNVLVPENVIQPPISYTSAFATNSLEFEFFRPAAVGSPLPISTIFHPGCPPALAQRAELQWPSAKANFNEL